MEQAKKGRVFADLHNGPGAFVIPNPWDIGSAKILEHLGFKALATTSAGFAYSQGRLDGGLTREEALAHSAVIVLATSLPVSADLENGFGDSPDEVAKTVRLAAEAGLAGCSIEDATGRKDEPIYERPLAVERIHAAVEAARALKFPFTLTARAENFLHGRPDLDDTIGRLQAFQETGADVLYAPGLTTREQIEAVVRSVDRPVNVLMGIAGIGLSLSDLSAIGVKRVSLGGALYRAAMKGLFDAAEEMLNRGTFTFTDGAAPSRRFIETFTA